MSETSRGYFIKDFPEITTLLIPPTGDSRATFLFPKYGKSEKLKRAFEETIEGFEVVLSRSLMEKEAFGPVKDPDKLQTAIGDLTALSVTKMQSFTRIMTKIRFPRALTGE